jgi:hypothetical protein
MAVGVINNRPLAASLLFSGKMSIPEKRARSSGKSVSSWRDMSPGDRENSVRNDLTSRLKCVCKDLSSVDFEALVAKMTSEQLRGERIPRIINGVSP